MELKDAFNGDNAALIRSIKALLELDAAGVLRTHGIGEHARSLLAAAAEQLETAAGEHDELVKLRAATFMPPPAQDGLIITRAEHTTDDAKGYQHYHVELNGRDGGRLPHFYALRVVKTLNAGSLDARTADHFAAIERRLLAGNPVEA
ncbi:hypothetical protein DC1_00031 [Burkholderia phage DC1]|uniref:Uncharacterized protein n=1 Tax=Burkholderia phage DC1 TaxID=2881398 RepID=I6NMK9_9CAUD|nr:hypothetical protein B862_gp52 [Burkholderia phage DC1]AEZ50849.1 hypothetical protein DC1_00031 [Burkholderia phage DC1]